MTNPQSMKYTASFQLYKTKKKAINYKFISFLDIRSVFIFYSVLFKKCINLVLYHFDILFEIKPF